MANITRKEMASAVDLRAALDIMREAWTAFELLQGELHKEGAVLLTEDEDVLLLYASDEDFKYKIDLIRGLQLAVTIDANASVNSPLWNTRQDKFFRFLKRTSENFEALVDGYQHLAERLRDSGSSLTLATTSFTALKNMVCNLVFARRFVPPSWSWSCHLSQSCALTDHFHGEDYTMWPMHDASLEKEIPIGSAPTIDRREFEYKPVVCPSHCRNSESAANALEESVSLLGCEESFTATIAPAFIANKIEPFFKKDKPLQSLAAIGFELSRLLRSRMHDGLYTLGIILPGGSRVFRPRSAYDADEVLVYIKANEHRTNGRIAYIFDAVTEGEDNFERSDQQTKQFLDLPPEIRNMIYRYILLQTDVELCGGHRKPYQQPAILQTCRTVNKEMTTLALQKYGWLVCK